MIVLATAAIFSCAEVQDAINDMHNTPWLTPVQREEIVQELLLVLLNMAVLLRLAASRPVLVKSVTEVIAYIKE